MMTGALPKFKTALALTRTVTDGNINHSSA
jgi:hypothetical protein